MTRKLLFIVGEISVKSIKTKAKGVYFPIEEYEKEIAEAPFIFGLGDVWLGMKIFQNYRKQIKISVDRCNEVIILTQNFSRTTEGFIHSFAKYLRRKNKKMIIILNGNHLSRYFLAKMNKYAKIIDVFADKEYREFFGKHYPKVSILELDGLLNTIYLRELQKYA